MSNSDAAVWLMQGVAAARGGDQADARYFLERALINNPTPEEEAEARLWLSRMTDDPAEKRQYLMEVLAIDPYQIEARQELAILDGRLKPEEIVDHRQPVPPVMPAPVVASADVRRYVCPQCAGKMTFDAEQRALTCAYCGYRTTDISTAPMAITEQDFLTTLPTARAHRWELPASRVLVCQGCGANLTLPPAQATLTCPFCTSAHIVQSAGGQELIAPGGILPFQFDVDTARQKIARWLAGQRFRPDDLDAQAEIARPRPVYYPFWSFDVAGELRWRGWVLTKVGDNEISREMRTGSWAVWQNDCLVPASHSLPATLLSALSALDTTALLPYSSDFLADCAVEIYQIPLADASLVAHQRAFEAARQEFRSDMVIGAVEDLTVSGAGIVIESYKLILLPVWVTSYCYRGKTYRVVVNGQTGEVRGEVPRQRLQGLLAGIFGDR